MRQISQLLLIITTIIFTSCSGEQDKEFEKIQYASFDVNSYRTPQKDTPFIALYSEIEADGQIHIYDDNEYKNQNNYSTVKLSQPQLDSLKAIFNSNDKLAHRLKEYQFQSGEEFFAGSYDFYIVIYKNGIKDTICTIQPFMDDKLEKIHVMLEDLYYSDTRQKIGDPVKPTSVFIKSLYKTFISNKLLPPIQNPPAFHWKTIPS
jgi:hypothetical protein